MSKLDALRLEIDGIDEQLFRLFLRRMELVRAEAESKLASGVPVMGPGRDRESMTARAAQSPPELAAYAADYFKGLVALTRDMQEAVIREAVEQDMNVKQ